MRGIHRLPVYSLHKGSVTPTMFPFDDIIIPCVCFIEFGVWRYGAAFIKRLSDSNPAWRDTLADIVFWMTCSCEKEACQSQPSKDEHPRSPVMCAIYWNYTLLLRGKKTQFPKCRRPFCALCTLFCNVISNHCVDDMWPYIPWGNLGILCVYKYIYIHTHKNI